MTAIEDPRIPIIPRGEAGGLYHGNKIMRPLIILRHTGSPDCVVLCVVPFFTKTYTYRPVTVTLFFLSAAVSYRRVCPPVFQGCMFACWNEIQTNIPPQSPLSGVFSSPLRAGFWTSLSPFDVDAGDVDRPAQGTKSGGIGS